MKKISIAILTLLVTIAACKKVPEVNLKYVDVERDLITVGTTTATVQCDYQYIATLKKAYFYYGEGENEPDMNTAEMRVVLNTLYVDLSGLKENTTYSYYYEFYNGFNSMRTVAKTFKTETTLIVVVLPTVITAEVTEITESSAQCGGEVTNDGGAEVTERGICWSTNENPTMDHNHVAAGTGIGAFTAMMNGLEANTTYHVRAYATNEAGTAYGLDREFVTLGGGGSGVPEGAINGLFTINKRGDQVYFSQGNLQYQASTNTWRFAEHQWDYVGNDVYGTVYENGMKCDNGLISNTYDGWIDLFGWGTSGYNHGSVCYQPFSTVENNENYWVYCSNTMNLYESSSQADWGYNRISNGGDQEGLWRTLTGNSGEIYYLFKLRNTPSGIRYAAACVNNVNGVVLFPDNWDESYYHFNNVNGNTTFLFSNNIITLEEWNTLIEPKGCVFFPITGLRISNSINNLGEADCGGHYWSSSICIQTSLPEYDITSLFFYSSNIFPADGTYSQRCHGRAVRLVHDVISQPSVYIPKVVTSGVSDVTSSSAVCTGEVINDGGGTVTERGICWSTNANPTLNDSHVAAGTGTGAFTAMMNGLEAGTTYHVRAYATNEVGTAFGLDLVFTTLSGGGSGVPEGAINGLFTINENGDQVYFSKGNLQYQASTDTWRFAENQWGSEGENNTNISDTYNGWIDLFGWGTSGYNHGANCYQPWSTSTVCDDYHVYGNSSYDLCDQSGQADWGYNAISNGGNVTNQWHTLSIQEWDYVINHRPTSNGIHFAKAIVNGVDGLVLLPDNWTPETYDLNSCDNSGASFADNIITSVNWNTLEANGVVFLPMTGGERDGHSMWNTSFGFYWSASHYMVNGAYVIIIGNDGINIGWGENNRSWGHAVRLVQDANL